MRRTILLAAACALAACVPAGPPTSDAGVTATTPAKPAPPKPPAAPRATASARPSSRPLGPSFEDKFERADVGPDWRQTAPGIWKIEAGRLCGRGAKNHGVWLDRVLPTNARIEFDAISNSPDGDLKAEIFGDGASAATGASYTDATSYLTILGGWKNHFHVLARIDEHAANRLELKVEPGADDERARPVAEGQVYHFKVERADGKTISWWVGDNLMHKLVDPEPLVGPGHDHFGFNDWDVPVCFDNVRIEPL